MLNNILHDEDFFETLQYKIVEYGVFGEEDISTNSSTIYIKSEDGHEFSVEIVENQDTEINSELRLSYIGDIIDIEPHTILDLGQLSADDTEFEVFSGYPEWDDLDISEKLFIWSSYGGEDLDLNSDPDEFFRVVNECIEGIINDITYTIEDEMSD